MKIATFNVNGVNGRLPRLLEWLKETSPGIVCLQELKAPQESFPGEQIEKAGYGAIWHGQKSWNGVAILTRGAQPIETRRGLPASLMMFRAVTSRRRSAASSWAASICRMAIPRPGRSSTTNFAGSSG